MPVTICAASLWVVAAIGIASGAGFYSAAVITTVLVLVSLWPLRIVAYRLLERVRPGELRLEVELRSGESASVILDALEKRDVAVRSFEADDTRDRRRLLLDIHTATEPHALTAELMRLDQVIGVRWRD